MGKEPTPTDEPELPFEQDMPPAERDALIRGTLKTLQEAFLATDDGDDADTITKLHEDGAEEASAPTETLP